MSQFFHSVAVWWTTHQGWVGFIYFVIAIWVSLFTARAREFVIAPFRYSAQRMNERERRQLAGQLATLKSIRNNTYNLVVYIAYGTVDAIFWSGVVSLLMNAFTIILGLMLHNREAFSVSAYSAFFGGIIARAWMMRQTLGYLYNYDEAVKMLDAATATPAVDSPEVK